MPLFDSVGDTSLASTAKQPLNVVDELKPRYIFVFSGVSVDNNYMITFAHHTCDFPQRASWRIRVKSLLTGVCTETKPKRS